MRQKLDAASISTCLADADNSGCHLIWDMPSFFSLMLVIVCIILNFVLASLLGAKANVKHIIPADINGYSWCCLSHGHLYFLRN